MIPSSCESKPSKKNAIVPSKRCLTPFHRAHSPQGNFLKSYYFYGTIGAPNSLLIMRDPHEHKIRRTIVNPLFSQKSANALATMVQDKLEQALQILKRHDLEEKPIDIQRLYRCVTV